MITAQGLQLARVAQLHGVATSTLSVNVIQAVKHCRFSAGSSTHVTHFAANTSGETADPITLKHRYKDQDYPLQFLK